MLTLQNLYLALTLISVIVYYLINIRQRPLVLFIASITFIAALSIKALTFAILISTLNFFFGLLIEKLKGKQDSKSKLFWLFIIIDICLLAFSKFFSPVLDNFIPSFWDSIIDSGANYNYIIIPLGISYYTFQAIGYIIRINRGVEKAEHDYIKFATYLLFFPKFLAGPVLRSNHFLPQMHQPLHFNPEDLYQGSRLFLWGLFKKVVIADNLRYPVSLVYGNISDYSGTTLIFILLIQALYVYYDFSGYTDMAIGTARLFGIKIMDNFNRPFFARSVTDYWRRWHISLSSWTNDFIYSPFIIKFRKFENSAIVSGIFLTFFVVGIWHGMNWTFVILGILQAMAIVYEYYTKKIRHKMSSRLPDYFVKTTSRLLVYLFIGLSLVFFFASNITDAIYFLTHLFSFRSDSASILSLVNHKSKFILSLCFIIILMVLESRNEKGKNVFLEFSELPKWIEGIGYACLIAIIMALYSDIQSFYYMRF